MIDALFNGISGLNGFQTALNTESNNISNINTVAFKSDNLSFADQMYQMGVGKGVAVETIDKSFNQGNLKLTSNTYDMAIDGKGFFIVQGDTEELLYTRAGNFRMANDGTLQTPDGYNVKGIAATQGDILSSNAITTFTNEYDQYVASQITTINNGTAIETFNAKMTDYAQSATNDLETNSGNNYKTKEAKIADVQTLNTAFTEALKSYSENPIDGVASTKQMAVISFDPTQIVAANNLVELTVGSNLVRQSFDTDTTTTMNKLADSISALQGMSAIYDETTGELSVESLVPGKEVVVADAKVLEGGQTVNPIPNTTITAATQGSGKAHVLAIEAALKEAIENAGGQYLRITNVVDSTQTVLSDLQMNLSTLNLSSTPFGDLELDDGYMFINQDGNRYVVGKISTAVFSNELGLDPKGNNLFSATNDSGDMVFATSENKIQSSTLELANSEIGESLVNLMVYQRSFEASSKAVTTSDEFLKTAIALKK
jgi:flagellar hook protein FlgE